MDIKKGNIKKLDQNLTLQFQKNVFEIANNSFLFLSSILMIFSFFYNLPILNYGIDSSYELRIYDVVGIVFFYYHYKNKNIISYIINNVNVFKWFWYLFKWASISLILTLFFSIYFDKLITFIQTILYLYHFYIFFISGVFIYIICLKKNKLNNYIRLIFIFSIVTCLIVIFQNFGFIPFLWNQKYNEIYLGFLSGTLGPNKIVLGMTSLFIFIFSISVFLEKKIRINFVLTILTILFSFYTILISGSRTAYLGTLIFISYFAIYNFGKFIAFSTVFVSLCIGVIILNNQVYDKVESVINGRVYKKIKNKEDLSTEKAGDLYEDLGSGRKMLSEKNGMFILENPIVIPFGMGFNNKLIIVAGSSAHNMYLQIIKELGLVGFILYFGWLLQYLFIKFEKHKGFSIGLKGLIISLLVTAFFGEQLYIYRALFGILGLFFVISSLFIAILHKEHFD